MCSVVDEPLHVFFCGSVVEIMEIFFIKPTLFEIVIRVYINNSERIIKSTRPM